jgi:hypothetical protein
MDALSLQRALERAWQPTGASRRAFNRLGLSVRNSETTELSNQGLLERLEGENAQLRGSMVDLALQIQTLRDGVR